MAKKTTLKDLTADDLKAAGITTVNIVVNKKRKKKGPRKHLRKALSSVAKAARKML